MKNLTWPNPEQLFVAQVLIKNVKLKCCGFLVIANKSRTTAFLCMDLTTFLYNFRMYEKPQRILRILRILRSAISGYSRY